MTATGRPVDTSEITADERCNEWQVVFAAVEHSAGGSGDRESRRRLEPHPPLSVHSGVGAREALSQAPSCRGGCGKPMPPGQKCVECATAAVDVWLLLRERSGACREPEGE